MATEAPLILSPLYMHVDHVSGSMGHMTTLIDHQTCRLYLTSLSVLCTLFVKMVWFLGHKRLSWL